MSFSQIKPRSNILMCVTPMPVFTQPLIPGSPEAWDLWAAPNPVPAPPEGSCLPGQQSRPLARGAAGKNAKVGSALTCAVEEFTVRGGGLAGAAVQTKPPSAVTSYPVTGVRGLQGLGPLPGRKRGTAPEFRRRLNEAALPLRFPGRGAAAWGRGGAGPGLPTGSSAEDEPREAQAGAGGSPPPPPPPRLQGRRLRVPVRTPALLPHPRTFPNEAPSGRTSEARRDPPLRAGPGSEPPGGSPARAAAEAPAPPPPRRPAPPSLPRRPRRPASAVRPAAKLFA